MNYFSSNDLKYMLYIGLTKVHFYEKVKFLLFPAFLLWLLLVLTALRIHGSSVGFYNQIFYGSDYKDPNLIFGHARGIRSDEWLVSTPWTLSQEYNSYESQSDIFIQGQNFTLTDVPVKNWVSIFRPQNLVFFILPIEHAFSFKWWFKGFLLILSFYLLFMLITKNDYVVSIFGSLSIFFLPVIQWWYSTNITEISSFGILTLYFYLRLIHKIINNDAYLIELVLFTYFSICFGLTLYPPFQIPLLLMMLFVGVSYLYSAVRRVGPKKVLVPLLFAVSSVFFVAVLFFVSNKETISVMMNTSYPGRRVVLERDITVSYKIFYGFYNTQLLNERNILPPMLQNQSEASSFPPLSLFLLPSLCVVAVSASRRKSNESLFIIPVILVSILIWIWALIGLPPILTRVLLLMYVLPGRGILALALLNTIVCVILSSQPPTKRGKLWDLIRILYAVGIFFIVFAIGMHLRNSYPQFISNHLKIFLISLVNALFIGLLLFRKGKYGIVLFLIINFYASAQVNPIYVGLSPLRNTEILSLFSVFKNDQKIASYHPLMANYLAANGIRVLNGTYYQPNINFWRYFDPNGNKLELYNRYAHIFMVDSGNPEEININLLQTDVVQISISPCNKVFRQLGIEYFLFTSYPENAHCLQEQKSIHLKNISLIIYSLKEASDD